MMTASDRDLEVQCNFVSFVISNISLIRLNIFLSTGMKFSQRLTASRYYVLHPQLIVT